MLTGRVNMICPRYFDQEIFLARALEGFRSWLHLKKSGKAVNKLERFSECLNATQAVQALT